jgi:hypothetical protein
MPETALARDWLEEFGDVFCNRDGKAQAREHKQDVPRSVSLEELPYFPFVTFNRDAYQVLGVDVDYIGPSDQAPIIPPFADIDFYERYGIPWPNLTVQTTHAPNFQAFWFLKEPLPLYPSPDSGKFFRDVHLRIIYALAGDPSCNVRGNYRNATFLDAQARCFSRERRTLSELNPQHISIPGSRFHALKQQYYEGNRNNCTFHELLRRYKELGGKVSAEDLLAYAKRCQDLWDDKPLDDKENLEIAKSVVRNGWKYEPFAVRNYGAMNLDPAPWHKMSPEECEAEVRRRRGLGGYYASEKRKQHTRERLLVAVDKLRQEGRKVTQRAVAARSGCAIQTVNSHWPSLF